MWVAKAEDRGRGQPYEDSDVHFTAGPHTAGIQTVSACVCLPKTPNPGVFSSPRRLGPCRRAPVHHLFFSHFILAKVVRHSHGPDPPWVPSTGTHRGLPCPYPSASAQVFTAHNDPGTELEALLSVPFTSPPSLGPLPSWVSHIRQTGEAHACLSDLCHLVFWSQRVQPHLFLG